MTAYRETFRRHRVLYCLPPLLALIVMGVLAVGSAKKYESSASLWVDNGPSAGSSLSSNGASDPSASEQTLLNELLATKSFDIAVGRSSSLNRYISAQGGDLASAVSSGAGSIAPGPQVLVVNFTGPSPAIAQSALQSLVTHLQNTVSHYGQTYGQAAQSYYQTQVKTATQAVSRATSAANAYKASHPSATSANSQGYAALLAAQQSASSDLASATAALNQATGQAGGSGASTLVRLVDPPTVPSAPTSGKKKMVMEILGGLFAGMLLSLLIIVAKTPSREDRWDAEFLSGDELTSPVQPQSGSLARQGARVDHQPAIANSQASPAAVTPLDTQRRQFATRRLTLNRRPAE